MKKHTVIFSALTLFATSLAAQTEVTTYTPGVTTEGITYFLPTTYIRVAVKATKVHHIPGEYGEYAERYLQLKNVPLTEYDEWSIEDVTLNTYGAADKTKAFSVKLKAKTAAPLVSLANDGRLLSINAQSNETERTLPVSSVIRNKQKTINGEDYKTVEILSAGSKSKMAELTANEIYDIRENRSLLTKGQADFMPKDGEQLKLMLASLDAQEEGLLQLFRGTTTSETHILTFDFHPEKSAEEAILFNFSKYLGFVDADDPAGVPVYIRVTDLNTLPAVVTDPNAKPKKEAEDIRYIIPGRAKVQIASDEREYASQTFPMAQYGRIEHLGGELFNKKYTTHVQLSSITGGIEKIDAEKPE